MESLYYSGEWKVALEKCTTADAVAVLANEFKRIRARFGLVAELPSGAERYKRRLEKARERGRRRVAREKAARLAGLR